MSIRSLALLIAATGGLLQAQEAEALLKANQQPSGIEIPDDRIGPLGGPSHGITDKARLRAEATRRWFGEWSPEFRAHMMAEAAREREAYRHLMPRNPFVDAFAAAPATGTWVNLGPTKADVIKNGPTSLYKTDSGRLRSILVDPTNSQVIYLCTSGGGVWKTTNGGSSWTPITDTLGSLSSGYLAMDPANSQILYLGLGDPFDGTGIGIVKSTDGGATWGTVKNLGTSRTIQSVMVHPQNSQIVLVSTNAGLYRSTDGGTNYSAVGSVASTLKCWDLAWAGGTSFVLTVEDTTSGSGRMLRSTDSGATWSSTSGISSSITRMSVASAPSNRSILYAMASGSNQNLEKAYKSNDGGATWSSLSTSAISDILGGQGFYNHMILVDRTNSNTVYFGGQLYVAKSTNGGSSWSKKSDWLAQNGLPYVHADMHCATQDSNGTIYVGSDGGVFKSTDGGASWSDSLNVGISSHLIWNMGCSPAKPDAVIIGLQDNGTRLRSGATSTFNQYIGGDGFGCLIHPVNANQMLGSLYYTAIMKSTDGGNSFSEATSGIPEANDGSSAPFITRIVPGLADSTGNTVYTFANNKVYKSTNFGSSWTGLGTSGLPSAGSYGIRHLGTAKSNASVVGLVASGGSVYLTANGGSTWTKATALPNNGSGLSSIAFDPTNHNVVYVTSVAPDATWTHLWKSTNFGGAWTELKGSGLPNIPVNLTVVDPGDRNVVYAATHLGLYRSGDGGSTWTRWGTGLPLVNVTDVYVSPDSSKVRVATFGRGVWELNGKIDTTVQLSPKTATVSKGATFQFTATVTGNINTNVTWKSTGGSVSATGLFTAPQSAGSYTVTATAVADSTKSDTATVTVPEVAVSISPATATVELGKTFTFSAAVTGHDTKTVTWSCTAGTITSGGVYTPPSSVGTYTVRATSTADATKWAEATVKVIPTPPLTINPPQGSVEVGGTLQLQASVPVTWSTNLGTVSATGLFTAPLTPGAATVRATAVSDPAKFAEATITVTPKPILVAVSPSTATVVTGKTFQFSASVTNTTNTAVTWSVTGGSVSSTGLYTAPTTPGTYVLRATSVADATKYGQATITVTAAGQEVLLNGGFESGASNWSGITGVIGAWAPYQSAFEGTKCAWFGGNGYSSNEYLFQQVTIPATATRATLSYALRIQTAETAGYDKDTFTVYLSSAYGQPILGTYSNRHAAAGYIVRTHDLSAYRGKTLWICFNSQEDSSNQTSFLLDKVSLQIQ